MMVSLKNLERNRGILVTFSKNKHSFRSFGKLEHIPPYYFRRSSSNFPFWHSSSNFPYVISLFFIMQLLIFTSNKQFGNKNFKILILSYPNWLKFHQLFFLTFKNHFKSSIITSTIL